VLGLAAFNLFFRLGREGVTEWDESLYAISAWEMLHAQEWIGTRFLGALDYYNTKPPLNIWLIALTFKAFGVSLWSLRLISSLSAFCTVAVLQHWTKRCFGAATGVCAGAVLATTFGFVYVHSGRTADADALFALLVLLTVVTLWAARSQPWRAVWLGPLAAAVFLLKGTAVFMPLSIIVAVEGFPEWRRPGRWSALVVAFLWFAIPIMAWSIARWNLDHFQFFEGLLATDFLGTIFTVLEGHDGSPLYYLNILQKNHYDWLAAAAAAWFLFPPSRARTRELLTLRGDRGALQWLLVAWVAATVVIPSLMQTKLPWYLNEFYPVFAVGIACSLIHGIRCTEEMSGIVRRVAFVSVMLLAVGVAEGKLLWYSFNVRGLEASAQGLLMEERAQLAGHRLFGLQWNRAEIFISDAVVRAERQNTADVRDFVERSSPGDYLLESPGILHEGVIEIRSDGRHSLYRRVAVSPTDQDRTITPLPSR